MQLHLRGWMWATVAVLATPPAPSQTVDNFFDGSQLQEIRITMAAADWQLLHQNFRDDTYYKADFEWQGIGLKNCGIKDRGTGSRNPIKPGFTINFAKYDSAQRFLGLKTVVLRNFAEDPSMVHERLTMQMFARLGLPYEREVHAKLYVNGSYAGLFLAVEPIDEHFAWTRFDESNGYIYEYKWNGVPFYFDYLGDDPALYVPGIFEAKTQDKAPQAEKIRDMIRTANFASDADFPTGIAQYLDLGEFVTHAAAEQFMGERDGIFNTDGMRNFYLYRRVADDRFFFLVWDKEGTFANGDLSIWSGTDLNILMRRSLAVPEIKQRYLEALAMASQIAGGPGGWLEQQVHFVLNQIRPAVQDDPALVCLVGADYAPCTLERFEQAAQSAVEFAENRSSFVDAELNAAGMILQAEALMPGRVMSAASLAPRLVPGSLARVDVSLSVPSAISATQGGVPAELGGVSVDVAGVKAPVLAVAPDRVLIQVPWEVPCGPASVVVHDSGRATNAISAEIAPSSPGIFVATHADGQAVLASSPAEAGEAIVLYATGLGDTSEVQTTGESASGTGAVFENTVGVLLAGMPVRVLWAGLTPGFVGLQQVNIELPAMVSPGNAALQLTMYDNLGPPYELPLR